MLFTFCFGPLLRSSYREIRSDNLPGLPAVFLMGWVSVLVIRPRLCHESNSSKDELGLTPALVHGDDLGVQSLELFSPPESKSDRLEEVVSFAAADTSKWLVNVTSSGLCWSPFFQAVLSDGRFSVGSGVTRPSDVALSPMLCVECKQIRNYISQ